MRWNKRFYTIHGWLGLNFGLALFVVCLSGTFAVVSHEIDWLLNPELRVTPQASRASYGDMYQSVQEAFPEDRIGSAWAPQGPRFACEFWVRGESGGNRRVYVDPYTAEVTGEGSWFNTQRFFRDFHRRFFWNAWWGIWLVAAYGFILLVASGTGLAFYHRWWAKFFTLRWSSGGRLRWADVHRLSGLWTLLFSILISLTGIWYFVEIPLADNMRRPPRPKLPPSSIPAQGEPIEHLPLDQWVAAAQKSIPELDVRTIWFPTQRAAVARIEGQASAWFVRDRANQVLVDPYTGEALYHQRAEQLSPYWRWVDTADPLHFGNFWGLASKLIWFILGLILSILMPTGAYLWTRRAEQIAMGTNKRLDKAIQGLTTTDRKYLIQRATRRNTGLGIISTTGILALAFYATWKALRRQIDSDDATLWDLGGIESIAVYGGFSLLILVTAIFWYRCIWLASYTPDAPTRPAMK